MYFCYHELAANKSLSKLLNKVLISTFNIIIEIDPISSSETYSFFLLLSKQKSNIIKVKMNYPVNLYQLKMKIHFIYK